MQLQHVGQSYRALSPQQLDDYQRDGFVVLPGLFSADDVDEIRAVFMEQVKDGPVQGLSDVSRIIGHDDPLYHYGRLMHPHKHPDKPVGPVAMRYLLDGRIENALWDLFGEEPIAAQSMFYYKPPGARGQDLHQDNFYLRVKPGTCMAAWVAIDDADAENGGMMLVPGSHRTEVVCPEKSDPRLYFTTEHVPIPAGMQAVQTQLKAGDCLFFNGSVIHGSPPNASTDRFRRAFICHYVPAGSIEMSAWYRPLLRFDGTPVNIKDAEGGGPCGNVQAAAKAPH
jgi:phytanoyl-CoA hydroxylase